MREDIWVLLSRVLMEVGYTSRQVSRVFARKLLQALASPMFWSSQP